MTRPEDVIFEGLCMPAALLPFEGEIRLVSRPTAQTPAPPPPPPPRTVFESRGGDLAGWCLNCDRHRSVHRHGVRAGEPEYCPEPLS